MPVVVATNISALSASHTLSRAHDKLGASFQRLASGYRITSAKDDAAGLAISDSMRHRIRSLRVAERNSNDAVSAVQTADGALGQIADLLARMRELAVQGASGQLTSGDRGYLSTEFRQLQSEMGRIQSSTRFFGRALLLSGSNVDSAKSVVDALVAAGSGSLDSTYQAGSGPLREAHDAIDTAYALNSSPGSGPAFDAYQATAAAFQGLQDWTAPNTQAEAQQTHGYLQGLLADLQNLASTVDGTSGAIWDDAKQRTAAAVDFVANLASTVGVLADAYAGGSSASQSTLTFQIGIENQNTSRLSVSFGGLNLSQVRSTGVTVAGADGSSALKAIDSIDAAMTNVSRTRARYGATLNRLDSVVENTQIAATTLTMSLSRIRDLDVADEAAELSRRQVLVQAGTSIMAQANQVPTLALRLLG